MKQREFMLTILLQGPQFCSSVSNMSQNSIAIKGSGSKWIRVAAIAEADGIFFLVWQVFNGMHQSLSDACDN